PPAAAITTLSPRSRAEVAHSMTPLGLRCAEHTFNSCVNSSSSRTLTHDSISGRSDLEPRIIPTTKFNLRPPQQCQYGKTPPKIVPAGPRQAPSRELRPRR